MKSVFSRNWVPVIVLAGCVSTALVPAESRAQTKVWKGWKPLPHEGTTDVPVCAVSSTPGEILVFSKGIDDRRIYMMDYGDYRTVDGGWGEWIAVTEPAKTLTDLILGSHSVDGSVAAVRMQGPAGNIARGYMLFYKDTKGRIRTADAREVDGGGLTHSAPSAVVAGDGVHLFVRGLNDSIWTNVLTVTSWTPQPTLGGWSGWAPVPTGDLEGTTDVTPAAVSSIGTGIFLFGKGIDDHQVYVNRMHPVVGWSGWEMVPGDMTTNVALSAVLVPDANFIENLYLFATRTDGKIFMNMLPVRTPSGEDVRVQYPPVPTWRGWEEIPGFTTNTSPSATVTGVKLWVFARRDDSTIHYNEEQWP